MRHECPQDVGIVSSCDEDHYSNIEISQVLLVRDSLVKCNEDIKFILREGEEFAILFAVPTHVLDCSHIVSWEVMPKDMGHILIE